MVTEEITKIGTEADTKSMQQITKVANSNLARITEATNKTGFTKATINELINASSKLNKSGGKI